MNVTEVRYITWKYGIVAYRKIYLIDSMLILYGYVQCL